MRALFRRTLALVLFFGGAVAFSSAASESILDLQAKAQKGDAAAQNELALRYESGDGVDRDLSKAVALYRSAAKQGFVLAYFNLGRSYYNGEALPANGEAACKWFLLASDEGELSAKAARARSEEELGKSYSRCVLMAADAYLLGQEIPRNPKLAREMYERLAQNDDPAAPIMLWNMYSKGMGVDRNPDAALQWLRMAADRHTPLAYFLLGHAYEVGEFVPADAAKACHYFSEGVRRDSADSMLALARLTRDGIGTKRDLQKAWVLGYRSAAAGNKDATSFLHDLSASMPNKAVEAAMQNAKYNLQLPSCR